MKITQNVKLLVFFFFISLLFIAVSAGESKCKCSHEGDEENKAGARKYKIAAIPCVLASGVIGVLFPLLGKYFPSLKPETNFFFVTKAFAAGVILATGFMHVLPEGYEKLTSPCLEGGAWEFPFTGFIAMVAAILTLSVDSFATSYFYRLHFKPSKKIGDGEERSGGGGDELGLHVHAHGHAHGIVGVDSGGSEVQTHRSRVVAQMSAQDEVNLVVGSWAREDGGCWIFEPETTDGSANILLRQDLTFRQLLHSVRERLQLNSNHITIKLAYQYPPWMAIDDGDGSTPQYITDDEEVKTFIQMRRHIEEVNLCVTVTVHINGVPTVRNISPAVFNREPVRSDCLSGQESDSATDSDEEWHQFAMSDTPMTFPSFAQKAIPQAPLRRGRSMNARSGGIIIREGEPVIRLLSPVIQPGDKGKGIADETESDSDSDEDAGVVPVVSPIRHQPPPLKQTRAKVRRRLFSEFRANRGGEDDWEPNDEDDPEEYINDEPLENEGYSRWGRFEEALHQMLTDFGADPALFDRDAPPVFDTGEIDELDEALADVAYEGDKLFVGRVFKSKSDCKIKIAIHAINRRFHFRTTRSSPKFMVLKCISPQCRWRVYAVLLDITGNFQIRQATLKHSCTVDARRNYHRLATTQVIGELMQSKFVGIKKGPTPAGIRKFLLDEFHVNVSYWKAWRAREVAMENSFGSMAGSYALIPAYLALLQNANPGTICFLDTVANPDGGTRFKYCFLAYGASIAGFPFMRKVIVIDGTSLKGRYGGCLVSACAQDANFQIFPLAFAIVDSENDDAWEWFFQKLNSFVVDSPEVVFVSDRHSSIYTGLERVFPLAHHAACTVHLWRNVRASYKPPRLANLMSAAARAFTVKEFNKKFLEIQKLNPGCAAYLVNIGFEHWTRVHFKGNRYNIMDSNIAESWNAVLKEAREFPLICMLEYIRTAVMSWFAIRREKATRHEETITPHARKLVEKNFQLSTGLAVRAISPFEFQVQEPEGECSTVKLVEGTCSCMEFQFLGIPCKHAIAAAGSIKVPTDSMVSVPLYGETWKNGFEGKIYPVPSVGGGEIGGGFSGELQPPEVRRPPGRPKKIRIPSRGEVKRPGKKSGRRCTRCRRQGHNKASCRNAI